MEFESLFFESAVSLAEIKRLNFSDEDSRLILSELMVSDEFGEAWTSDEGPLPWPTRSLSWDDFDSYYAQTDYDIYKSLRCWLLEG